MQNLCPSQQICDKSLHPLYSIPNQILLAKFRDVAHAVGKLEQTHVVLEVGIHDDPGCPC